MSGVLTQIGRYKVHSLLGQGNMGAVYKAFDPNLQRYVAVKMIHARIRSSDADSVGFRDRFHREAQAVSQLNHPNVVGIYDSGFHEQEPYIVMEYVDGMALDQAIKKGFIRDLDHKLVILRDIGLGLDYAHGRGVVHRDIKPANIIVTADGSAKLVDFGLAKLADSKLTTTGEFLGTPSYAAPEQVVSGTVNERTDLFSFAVMSHEMLVGRRPFPGDNINSILYHLVNSPPEFDFSSIKCDAPHAIRAVFTKALSKEARNRYASASSFIQDLETSLAGTHDAEATLALTHIPSIEQHTPPSKRLWLALVLVPLFILVSAGLWAFKTQNWPFDRQPIPVPIDIETPAVAVEDVGDITILDQITDDEDEDPPPDQVDVEQLRIAEAQRNQLEKQRMITDLQQSFFEQVDARQLDDAELTLLKLESLDHDTSTEHRILKKVTQQQNIKAVAVKPAPIKTEKVDLSVYEKRFVEAEQLGQIQELERVVAEMNLATKDKTFLTPYETRLAEAKREQQQRVVEIRAAFEQGIASKDVKKAREQLTLLVEHNAARADDREAVAKLDKSTYVNSLNMRFLKVPAGSFQMGNQTPVIGSDDLLHSVVLSKDFMISVFEVTQAQWQAVMGNNPSTYKGDDMPVHDVSWKDAKTFIKRLNGLENSDQYRLPTEAEWEYACRAGSDTLYNVGDSLTSDNANFRHDRSKSGKPVDVGSYTPNRWGLYDLHGNVWEWCEDIYAPYPNERVVDPVVEKALSPSPRVIRGGSFVSDDGKCESGFRGVHLRSMKNSKIGFRVVREMKDVTP